MTSSSRRDLFVIGSGGFGRETVEAVRAINAADGSWQILGYLDDDPALHGKVVDGVPVLGGIAEVRGYPGALVVVCTGRPDNYLSRPKSSGPSASPPTGTPPSSTPLPACLPRQRLAPDP